MKPSESDKDWELWEVFVRSQKGLAHRHVGSLQAANHLMALQFARDLYCRRGEVKSVWVVPSREVYAAHPDKSNISYEAGSTNRFRDPETYITHSEAKASDAS